MSRQAEREHLYFAQSARDSSIKIGRSIRPHARAHEIGQHYRDTLTVLAVWHGRGSLEHATHLRFRADNIVKPHSRAVAGPFVARVSHGAREWFRPSSELLAFIDDVNRGIATLAPGPCCELCAYTGSHEAVA